MPEPDDEFDAYVKQRIEDAFALGDLTDEERTYWEAHDRYAEACRRLEEKSRAAVLGNAKAIVRWINQNPTVLDEMAPGASTAMAEHGLQFVWEDA